MHAWSTSMLFLLHSTFVLSVVKMPLKGEFGGHALKSHGNYIVDHGKLWKNHGIVFLNFCGNPAIYLSLVKCTSAVFLALKNQNKSGPVHLITQ